MSCNTCVMMDGAHEARQAGGKGMGVSEGGAA